MINNKIKTLQYYVYFYEFILNISLTLPYLDFFVLFFLTQSMN